MLWQLMKKECLEHMMSLRFAIACVLCLVVVLCGVFVRHQAYAKRLNEYHEKVSTEVRTRSEQEWPWHIRWHGQNEYQKPNALKIFVRGVEDRNGLEVNVNDRNCPQPKAEDVTNRAVSLFPSMDIVVFVGLIMSLMAIVFGYDAICGEKQRGTLRMMLSYSVPRHLILLSKWIGGYVMLILPFVIAVIIGCVVIMSRPDVSLTSSQWSRLLVIGLFALLYIATMYSLAMFVSCLTARPSTSVMILLSIWVVFILAVPNLSPYVAALGEPGPNLQEAEIKRGKAARNVPIQLEAAMKEYEEDNNIDRKSLSWRNPEDRLVLAEWWKFRAKLRYELNRDRLAETARINDEFARKLAVQSELTRQISRVSPLSCFAMAATELADAGRTDHDRYLKQLRKHQAVLSAYLVEQQGIAEDLSVVMSNKTNKEDKKTWKDVRDRPVPTFAYEPASASTYAPMVAVDGGILVGMSIVLFMLSYLMFIRYDVR